MCMYMYVYIYITWPIDRLITLIMLIITYVSDLFVTPKKINKLTC